MLVVNIIFCCKRKLRNFLHDMSIVHEIIKQHVFHLLKAYIKRKYLCWWNSWVEEEEGVIRMVLKTGLMRVPEREVVPVSLIQPGSDHVINN